MLDKFLVLSPSRTGSLLIVLELERVFKKPVFYYNANNNLIPSTAGIIHSHLPRQTKVENKEEFMLIISRRRNEFQGIISQLIANNLTHEYSIYSDKPVNPICITLDMFDRYAKQRKGFYQQIDTFGYAKVVDIYLEDMLEYSFYLFDELGLTKQQQRYGTKKSPYIKELISNYDDLEQYWIKNYA